MCRYLIGVVGVVHFLVSAFGVAVASTSWNECLPETDEASRYFAVIFCVSSAFVAAGLAILQATDLDRATWNERNTPASLAVFLLQVGIVVFYALSTSFVCTGSDSAFALWILLGVIQGIYALVALMHLFGSCCAD